MSKNGDRVMDVDKLIMLGNLVPFGVFSLLFPKPASRFIEGFVKLLARIFQRSIDEAQLKVQPIYTRMLGGFCLVLAGLFYFDFIGLYTLRS